MIGYGQKALAGLDKMTPVVIHKKDFGWLQKEILKKGAENLLLIPDITGVWDWEPSVFTMRGHNICFLGGLPGDQSGLHIRMKAMELSGTGLSVIGGSFSGLDVKGTDGIVISGSWQPTSDIMIAYNSIRSMKDENSSCNGRKNPVRNVTFYRNNIGPGDDSTGHAAGSVLNKHNVSFVSYIENLFNLNRMRQPKANNVDIDEAYGCWVEIINNLYGTTLRKKIDLRLGTTANVIGNDFGKPNLVEKYGCPITADSSRYFVNENSDNKVYVLQEDYEKDIKDFPHTADNIKKHYKADLQPMQVGAPFDMPTKSWLRWEQVKDRVLEVAGAFYKDDVEQKVLSNFRKETELVKGLLPIPSNPEITIKRDLSAIESRIKELFKDEGYVQPAKMDSLSSVNAIDNSDLDDANKRIAELEAENEVLREQNIELHDHNLSLEEDLDNYKTTLKPVLDAMKGLFG